MAAATSVVVLDRGNNTTCTVNLHGATVVSWRVNNQEQLFVSKLAVFDGKKPIRGGIPFVFPQFGQCSFGPQHGFGRLARWEVERAPERLPNGDVEAVFRLMDSEFSRSIWNYPFRITYRLILREKELHFHIGVYNPSKDVTFSFNLLLHTYLKVPDVRRCQITGLHGCTFIDKTRDGAIYQEGRDVVTVNEWTDRIYQHTPQEHIVTNVVSGRKMRLQKYNFPDTVIWNPWLDKAREMSDFGDDEYPNMICVEAGHVSSPVVLLPGTAFEASQILQVSFVNGVSGGKPRRSKKNAQAQAQAQAQQQQQAQNSSGASSSNNNNAQSNSSSSSSNNVMPAIPLATSPTAAVSVASVQQVGVPGSNHLHHHPHLNHHPLMNLGPMPSHSMHHPLHHHHHHHHPLDANILNNNHNFR